MNRRKSVGRKFIIQAATIAIASFIPATTVLAWWCGTGRMTGGGKLVTLAADSGQLDVTSPTTNGYELHCDGSSPNNLEINSHDPNGFHFHLESLQTANCWLQFGKQNPPTAAFDTFEGVGPGTWANGNTKIEGCAEWIFIDGQGSAQQNSSYIRVTDQPPLADTDICTLGGTAKGKCPGNTVLLVLPQTPLSGQNQAHK